jgi:hypothetical protein
MCPDAAVFKPNPFSITKVNAFTQLSCPDVAKLPQVAERLKNTGTINAFSWEVCSQKTYYIEEAINYGVPQCLIKLASDAHNEPCYRKTTPKTT